MKHLFPDRTTARPRDRSPAGLPHWKPILLVLGVLAIVNIGSRPQATILGSAHDFSALDPDQQSCIFCHTAHNADITVNDAPLWNHEVTNKQYQVYNSPTLDAAPHATPRAPRGCVCPVTTVRSRWIRTAGTRA